MIWRAVFWILSICKICSPFRAEFQTGAANSRILLIYLQYTYMRSVPNGRKKILMDIVAT